MLMRLTSKVRQKEQKEATASNLCDNDIFPTGIYLFKVNNINTRTKCEISSKLTTNTRRRSGVFVVNFEHILHLVLVFLLLTLNR